MEYNYLTREVHMPEKHFKKDRHVKLGKVENMFFAVLWFSRENKANYKQIYERVYGCGGPDKTRLRHIARLIRNKKIPIESVYKYGYRLNIKND